MLVECAVVDEDAFFEIYLWRVFSVVGCIQEVGAVGLASRTYCEWKAAGGVYAAIEDIGDAVAGLFSWYASPEDAGYVGIRDVGV